MIFFQINLFRMIELDAGSDHNVRPLQPLFRRRVFYVPKWMLDNIVLTIQLHNEQSETEQ